jgi:hypothetical protein
LIRGEGRSLSKSYSESLQYTQKKLVNRSCKKIVAPRPFQRTGRKWAVEVDARKILSGLIIADSVVVEWYNEFVIENQIAFVRNIFQKSSKFLVVPKIF